jgi:hypothetical protein
MTLFHIPFYARLLGEKLTEKVAATHPYVLLYGAIQAHDVGEHGCIANNKTLAEETGISARQIPEYLNSLKKGGWINYELSPNGIRGKITPLLILSRPPLTESRPPLDKIKPDYIESILEDSKDSDPVAREIPLVIKAMESIDKKNKLYYGNKTQRKAVEFLIKEYTLETVLQYIGAIPEAKKVVPYFPSITTPCELRDKWVKIEDALQRVKTATASKKTEVSFG